MKKRTRNLVLETLVLVLIGIVIGFVFGYMISEAQMRYTLVQKGLGYYDSNLEFHLK